MREKLQSTGRLQYAREDTHRRETAPVRAVRQSFLQKDAVETTFEDPLGWKTVSVSSLPEGFRWSFEHDVAHETSFWIETVSMYPVFESVHQEASSQDSSQLSHRHQTVLVSKLCSTIFAEQQYENPFQKVYRQQFARNEKYQDREQYRRIVQGRAGKDNIEDTHGYFDAAEFGSRIKYFDAHFEDYRDRSNRNVARSVLRIN